MELSVCEQEAQALIAYCWSTKTEHTFMHTIRLQDVVGAHAIEDGPVETLCIRVYERFTYTVSWQSTTNRTQLHAHNCIHTHQTQVAHATSWQHLTTHFQHNYIKNINSVLLKKPYSGTLQDSTKCLM